jgi:RNA polymerase sigma factor (sigma-70 family)
MDFNAARLEIEKSNFKFWHLDEFDDEKQLANIMAEMPDKEDYLKRKDEIKKDKVSPECQQFYCEPLLSKEQEYHLFRKMNYLKYKAARYYRYYMRSNIYKMKSLFLEHMIEAHNVRNNIVVCNTRLAAQVQKKRKDYYDDDLGNLQSDCFVNIIKAVDGFDFRRGFKFSTYCTWVLMNNSLRDHQADKKFQDKFATNSEDAHLDSKIDEKASKIQSINEKHEALTNDVALIIKTLSEKDAREAEVIQNYFGLIDGKKKTLKEISEIMDITKERVRQIKNSAIKTIQFLIVNGHMKLDSEDLI